MFLSRKYMCAQKLLWWLLTLLSCFSPHYGPASSERNSAYLLVNQQQNAVKLTGLCSLPSACFTFIVQMYSVQVTVNQHQQFNINNWRLPCINRRSRLSWFFHPQLKCALRYVYFWYAEIFVLNSEKKLTVIDEKKISRNNIMFYCHLVTLVGWNTSLVRLTC